MRNWRYSDNIIVSLINKFLCWCGNHIWLLSPTGHHVNCTVCGSIGDLATWTGINYQLSKVIKENNTNGQSN